MSENPMSKKPLVRLQLDQSFLDSSFQGVNVKLKQHEEMILELQKLLREAPGRDDLIVFRDRVLTEMNTRTDQLNNRMDELEKKLEEKIKEMEDTFEKRILDTANMLNIQFRQKFNELNKPAPNSIAKAAEFEDRIAVLEQNLFSASKKLQTNKDCVKKIAESIGLFNDTPKIKLDLTLGDTLKGSVTSVKDNMKSINDEIEKLKDLVVQNKVSIEDVKNRQNAQNMQILQQQQMQQQQQESQENEVHSSSEFDITSIKLYPSMVAHWRDPPELPQLHQFLSIGEAIDYIYRVMPKLQAHLTAMQAKIVDNATEISNRVERPIVEKVFEKFQTLISELSRRIGELQNGFSNTASRDEINTIVADIFRHMATDNQTSIGRLKCMACGRDIPRVVGSLSEKEADEALGPPISSTVFHVPNKPSGTTALRYSDMEGFNSQIIESPISYRTGKTSKT